MQLFGPLWQQSLKHSGVYLLMIALVLAISATTALKFSHQQIQQAVALQAAEMLAADLVLSDQQPIAAKWQAQATQHQLQQAQVTSFSSMAHTEQQFVMVNVKAIDEHFPLRGEIRVQPEQAKHLQPGQIWLSPRALDLLQLKLGDSVHIADAAFQVSGIIEKDPNQELGINGFSPTVMISQHDVARTNAIQVGSRIEYRLLLAGRAEHTAAFERDFKQQQPQISEQQTDALEAEPNSVRLRNATEGNSRLMRPLANLETFLQLANLLTILLCGIAIALTSQRYVQQNQDMVALLRCMGASWRKILSTYMLLLAVVAMVSILLGALLGMGMGYALLQLMLQLVPHLQLEFSVWHMLFGPLPMAMLTSVMLLMGFVLPSLWQLCQTAPIRVLRAEQSQFKQLRVPMLWGALSLLGFSLVLTANIALTIRVLAALVVLGVLLYGVIVGIFRFIRAQQGRLAAYIRQPRQSALQITALALGLSLITLLAVLRTDLLERWQQQLPAQTPNQFVYGLPPMDQPQLAAILAKQQWPHSGFYPNIRGRLVAKNGQAFGAELIRQHNSLRRELNLTQAEHYPSNNQVVAGQARFSAVHQVSVEQKTAQALGIQLGDQLRFRLPEGDLTAQVINLRQVEWESFTPNFFFIFSPGSMDANSGSYLASFYVPKAAHSQLVQVIQQFANTVFIDVSLILDEIKRLIGVLVSIVTVLAVLVCVAGLLVLLACLNLMMDERKKEVALLRAFGASQQQLRRMLSIEIGLMGAVAGIAACVFAELMSAVVCMYMDLPVQFHVEIWLILPFAMTVLCGLIGRYRLGYLAELAPLQTLKSM